MEILLVAVIALALFVTVLFAAPRINVVRCLAVLVPAFALRLAVHITVTRVDAIGYGGDNLGYEAIARTIVQLWQQNGISFVTVDELSAVRVPLPCNLFALIMYACGGSAPLACTAFVAFVACATCIILYRTALALGAPDRMAFWLLTVSAFLPSFVLHTSDMYKDGFNAFLVIACVATAVCCAKRPGVARLLPAVPLLWALWYVRSYMVFLCIPPLLIGMFRPVKLVSMRAIACIAMTGTAAALLISEKGGDGVAGSLHAQLALAQSETVHQALLVGGSGVALDDDSIASFALRLVYTVFAPFPWESGTLALQLGKIDALIWYILAVLATIGARRLWKRDRTSFWVLLAFIVPSVVAYSISFANIGLVFRQRIPIVLAASLFAPLARISRGSADFTPDPAAERGEGERTGASLRLGICPTAAGRRASAGTSRAGTGSSLTRR
ncbi:hypothetical protein [Streptomyces cupreus]|uniref:Glycosyltransferase RgtA/B/C/D-like domain-containing protein n=1 Tax=Streptomyces cupreus TaxID=2759956 RepID=A0A7X1MCP3_9ACTN|nr:hypothetical protein [Streptomyces cupreus]MBC2906098.1 hypothetical protein [Streptomyces cupreus]